MNRVEKDRVDERFTIARYLKSVKYKIDINIHYAWIGQLSKHVNTNPYELPLNLNFKDFFSCFNTSLIDYIVVGGMQKFMMAQLELRVIDNFGLGSQRELTTLDNLTNTSMVEFNLPR